MFANADIFIAAKMAQRAIAETLRLECMRYSNEKSVYTCQCIFAHNFVGDTFWEEMERKPQLTRRIGTSHPPIPNIAPGL